MLFLSIVWAPEPDLGLMPISAAYQVNGLSEAVFLFRKMGIIIVLIS